MEKRGRIVGIGGVFFKSSKAKELKSWYAQKLGISVDQYGAAFVSRKYSKPEESSYLQWSIMDKDTDKMDPSSAQFMINYRVEHIEDLVEQLMNEGVNICDEIQTYPYGKFVHIIDPDGNKIELWEPVDKAFDEWYSTSKNPINIE